MKRFLLSSVLLFLLVAPRGVAAEQQADHRMNILFIMADDHSYQAMGCYGSRLAKLNPTPNLDRFAHDGIVFDQAYCANSICTPSRASVMTGQYSNRNGVYDLYDTLPGDRNHLSREMQQAGYQTAVIGKWHLKDSPRFFDYFAVIPGQGSYLDPVLHVSKGGTMRRVRYDSTLVRDIPVIDTKGHSSDVLTAASLAWLRGRDRSKPFFLMHQFKAPHDMFVYAPRYEDYLKDAEIPEPDNLYDQPGPDFGSIATRGEHDSLVHVIGSTVSPQPDKRNLASHYRSKILKLTGKKDLSKRELTHQTYQLYLREYLRCVKGIDDNLQRLLDYLREEGLMDDTLIVYTSDQGMMLGEHDYIDKRWMYEESIRLPLIVHWPGAAVQAGRRNDWLINNTDFAPTLLDAAGVATPGYMQGRSFLGALRGGKEPDDWRRASYYRYWMHMAHGHNNPAHFGIRGQRYKLMFFYGTDFTDVLAGKPVKGHDGNRFWNDTPAAWEFYDLQDDPHEMHNRYRDPECADIIAKMKSELRQLRDQLGDTDQDHPRIRRIIDAHWND